MGVYFTMGVLPFDDRGQVVLELVREPRFMVRDSEIWELLSESGGERGFAPALKDLSLRWYRQPSLDACVAEQRNPVRTDCFHAREIENELDTIHTRLRDLEGSLPRRYRVRMNDSNEGWASSVSVWFEGAVMTVGADWDSCMAMSVEHPLLHGMSVAEQLRRLAEHRPEIQIDLRGQDRLSCHEVTTVGGRSAPGRPVTLMLTSESVGSVFGGVLNRMEAFCRAVDVDHYCILTRRG